MLQIIPVLPNTQLNELVKRIRPVGRKNGDQALRYYHPCAPGECFSLEGDSSLDEEVAGLIEATRIKTTHVACRIGDQDVFMPSAAEVLAQIPDGLIEEVVAFEVLTPDFDEYTKGQRFHFRRGDEYYHRAITVLYGERKS